MKLNNVESYFLLIFVGAFFTLLAYFLIFKLKKLKYKEVEERHSSFLFARPLRTFGFWLIDPLLKVLINAKVPPSLITVSSAVISLFSGYLYAIGEFAWGSWVLALSSACDSMDGKLARELGISSKKGDFLDSCLDRFSDNFVFFGVLFYFRTDVFMFLVCSIIILSTTNVSYFRAKSESLGCKNSVGLMQRPERLFVLGTFGILSPHFSFFLQKVSFNVPSLSIFKFSLVFLAVMTFITSLSRLKFGLKEL